MFQDFASSLRRLKRSPGFVLVAVLSVAAGVGANSAVFGVVDGLLFRALPIPTLSTLVAFVPTRDERVVPGATLSADQLQTLNEGHLQTVDLLAAVEMFRAAASAANQTTVVFGEAVSGSYFQMVGVQPEVGRLLGSLDDRGSESPLVLGDALWREFFGADPRVVGRVVSIAGRPMTIVGVAPAAFHGLWLPNVLRVDAWVPLKDVPEPNPLHPGVAHAYRVFGQLKRGADFARARAEAAVIGRQLDPRDADFGLEAAPARSVIVPEEFDRYGWLLGLVFGALSALVLAIACANLTNLLLARTSNRMAEIAVRIANGANRWNIARLVGAEAVLVTGAGGVVGGLVAAALTHWFSSVPLPDLDGVSMHYGAPPSGHLVVYALVSATIASFTIGALPAWRASRAEPVALLASSAGAGSTTRRGRRLLSVLVASQVGSCAFLLLSAGLFIRSARAGLQYDPGFDTTHLAAANLDLSLQGYDETRGRQFYRRLLEVLDQTIGPGRAVLASGLPSGQEGEFRSVGAGGRASVAAASRVFARVLRVTPGFFHVAGIPLVSGRSFTSDDGREAPVAVVISRSLASELWGRTDPTGRQVWIDGLERDATVVGVVADTNVRAASPLQRRYVYMSLNQDYTAHVAVIARGVHDAASVIGPLRASVRVTDPSVALFRVETVADRVGLFAQVLATAAATLSVFGLLAGLIALVGVYGVTSYVVSLRTREFGILKALGATDGGVCLLVVRQGLPAVLAGIAIGLTLAYAGAGTLRHVLYGITPHDGMTFSAIPLGLAVVSVLASVVPAWRAGRVNAVSALRE